MLKLYKDIDGQLHYWESWSRQDGQTEVVHWGLVGEKGETQTITSTPLATAKAQVQQQLNEKIANGYAEIDVEDQYTLLIEYDVDGMGTQQDIEKRHRLEQRMDQTLGWTGLGNCDGGSTGSGTMEICCYVVDFETAKKVVEADLAGTEFADYSRIYDENDE